MYGGILSSLRRLIDHSKLVEYDASLESKQELINEASANETSKEEIHGNAVVTAVEDVQVKKEIPIPKLKQIESLSKQQMELVFKRLPEASSLILHLIIIFY